MRARRWLVTCGATAVSTYLLDAVATAAGLLLVATGALRGADHVVLLAFLGASYIAWGAGLRTSLRANATLLEQTGTSTNVLSKAAYELVGLRTTGRRARRAAAAIGYVAAELAKEAPYYAGAFGAALVSDSVSSNDALIFLAGANLAAAAYEYALGRATGTLLARRPADGRVR